MMSNIMPSEIELLALLLKLIVVVLGALVGMSYWQIKVIYSLRSRLSDVVEKIQILQAKDIELAEKVDKLERKRILKAVRRR